MSTRVEMTREKKASVEGTDEDRSTPNIGMINLSTCSKSTGFFKKLVETHHKTFDKTSKTIHDRKTTAALH
jgi:hypothetical protein